MDNQYNENDIFETEKVEERENPVEQVKAEEPAAVAASGSAAKKRAAEKNLRRRAQRGAVRKRCFGRILRGKQIPRRFVLLDGIQHFKRLDHKDDVGGRRKS